MKRKSLLCGGLLLLAAALFLTIRNFAEDHRAAENAQQALQAMESPAIHQDPSPAPAESSEPSVPAHILNPEMEMPTTEIDGIEYIGTLTLSTLGLELPIISAWSDTLSKRAPCRYKGSAYLGDLIIAGHNYRSHFGPLSRLTPGDAIQFTDTEGNCFFYEVSKIEELPGTALEEMEAGDWDLTLFTCTLSRTSRFTVRCEQVVSPETIS